MPYLTSIDKAHIDAGSPPTTGGELNYAITRLLIEYHYGNGGRYAQINDVMGACAGAQAEFYRRVAAPYEDKKIRENGDVYPPIGYTPTTE